MRAEPISQDIVLLGGGHAHVFVLKAFGMAPEPGVRLTLITKELASPYSGMLPGFVAGHYTLEECHIDLARLSQFADARIVHGVAIGIDRSTKRVTIEGRPSIRYDLLSINVGITPQIDDVEGADQHAIIVKPVSTFAPKWRALESEAAQRGGPRKIVAIGGGAAGVELILAVRHRIRALCSAAGLDPDDFHFVLIAGGGILASHNARAQSLARSELLKAHIEVIEYDPACSVSPSTVTLASGTRIPADAALISTEATAPPWLAGTGLPRSVDGFIAVRPTLQALDDDDVFAAGDCADVIEHPRKKSGVFAVRQGPALAQNLRFRLRGEIAQPFIPQQKFLALVSLGDRRAIAARGNLAATGAWAWTWKDRIDRTFMRKFDVAMGGDAAHRIAPGDSGSSAMRCGGCAAKIGPVILSAALDRFQSATCSPHARDDAAVIDEGGDTVRIETIDFFRAFWPDPYILGEIAANHALSDIFAMGGMPRHAQAIAVLPYARAPIVEDDLFQLLSGARTVFEREGVELIGGHSSEGAELAIGFAVSGETQRARLKRKGGLMSGDKLILTRPLGTGILFSAHMRGLSSVAAIEIVLTHMRSSNRRAAEILVESGATAMTDVTGFGLGGHLIEMLEQSKVTARLFVDGFPVYPTVRSLAEKGIVSTLQPENVRLASRAPGLAKLTAPELAILFDPQTSGGLLAGVPAAKAASCIEALHQEGIRAATVIGEVCLADDKAGGLVDIACAMAA